MEADFRGAGRWADGSGGVCLRSAGCLRGPFPSPVRGPQAIHSGEALKPKA